MDEFNDLMEWDSPLLAKYRFKSDEQSMVETFIVAARASMERYCNKYFLYGMYDHVLPVKQDGLVFLPAIPVDSVLSVMWDQQDAISISCEAVKASVTTSETSLILTSYTNGNIATEAIDYADNKSINDMVSAINEVGGWTATATNGLGGFPSEDLISPINSSCAGGGTTQLAIWKESNTRYLFDQLSGRVHLLAYGTSTPSSLWLTDGINKSDLYSGGQWPLDGYLSDTYRRARVIWNGGYQTMPANLVDVCATMVGQMYKQSNGLMQSETIGEYSYTLALANLNKLPVTERKILDSYKTRIC